MKIEHLIVQHLYNNKSVTLQGIGTIHLNPAVALPTGNEKDFVMPDNAFSFQYDLKAPEDAALIDFIVQQTRKIRPLATSDMESYSILAKQFLNIGKPLIIQGIGTIQKNQEGSYEFVPGHFITPRIDDVKPLTERITERTEEPVYETESTVRSSSNKKGLVLLLSLVALGLAGAAIYYFGFSKPGTTTEQVQEIQPSTQPAADSIAKTDSIKTDTTTIKVDSIAPATQALATTPGDSSTFKVVIKQYSSEAAVNRAFDRLTEYGHKVTILKKDSTTFQLVMAFTKPLSDTAIVRDSLRIFFGGKPFILR